VISKKWLLAAGSSVVLAFGVAACGSDNSSSDSGGSSSGSGATNLSGEIAGAGSSAQEAAQEAWRAGFQDQNSDLTISYDPVGSGGGQEQFIAGGVDYAGSDKPFDSDQLTQAAKNCGSEDSLVQIPVYISPLAVIYNLPDVDSLQLSPDTLAAIMNQKITAWNDPAIAQDNPGVDLPSTRITPVNRSDDSGTTFNFTDYLSKAAPDSWPYPAGETWPVKGGEAAEGTSGVVEAVTAGEGAIGYADASQAADLGIAKVKVGNEYLAPSADGAAHDLEISKTDPSISGDPYPYVFAYDIERTSTDTANYPLLLVSYLITCTQGSNASIVGPYFNYVISADGQQAAADHAGSAPITDKTRQQVQPAVDAIGG
jgi:phosphate transport system substrate-binding protein